MSQVLDGPEVDSETCVLDAAYECRIGVLPEEDGGFSVFALDLPGVFSQGETVDEAVASIRDAIAGAFEVYMEEAGRIPWKFDAVHDFTPAMELRIVVECPSCPS